MLRGSRTDWRRSTSLILGGLIAHGISSTTATDGLLTKPAAAPATATPAPRAHSFHASRFSRVVSAGAACWRGRE